MSKLFFKPHGFLFNADWPGFSHAYGNLVNRSFFSAVLDADQSASEMFQLSIGDLLLHELSSRTGEVGIDGLITSSELKINQRSFVSIIFDFCESASELWFSFDEGSLPLELATNSIYVLFASHIDAALRNVIDESLKMHPYYLGAFEADLGNPVHTVLLRRYLLHHYNYMNRSLTLTLERGPLPEDRFDLTGIGHWWSELAFVSVDWQQEAGSPTDHPPDIPDVMLSERGRRSAALLEELLRPTHLERVAGSLYEEDYRHSTVERFEKFSSRLPADFEQAVIPEGKLLGYSLNMEHPKGKHKAILFRDLLGITVDDWRILASQIMAGLRYGKVQRVRTTKYGVQYHVDVAVVGTNRETRRVRTSWIALSGQPARLTTVLIPSNAHDVSNLLPPQQPRVVNLGRKNAEAWRRLFDEAHEAGIVAAKQAIPSGMLVTSDWPQSQRWLVREGPAGIAWIVVPDGRSSFARWLRANSLGDSSLVGSGTVIPARSEGQSVERSRAYADAFARVLWLNGVDCRVKSHLD